MPKNPKVKVLTTWPGYMKKVFISALHTLLLPETKEKTACFALDFYTVRNCRSQEDGTG
jgi:hypothetical protein